MEAHLTHGEIIRNIVRYENLFDHSYEDMELDGSTYEVTLQLESSSPYGISIRAATVIGAGPAASFIIQEPEKGGPLHSPFGFWYWNSLHISLSEFLFM